MPSASSEAHALTTAEQQLIRDEERIAEAMQDSLRAGRTDRHGASVPDARVPYFGRMRIQVNGRKRDVLLGAGTYVDAQRNLRVIDWQTAPLAAIFFAYDAGEEFAEDLDDRELVGELMQQTLVTFDSGRLVRIVTAEGAFARSEAGTWSKEPGRPIPSLAFAPAPGGMSAGKAAGKPGLPLLSRLMATLDDDQRIVVERAGTTPLLVTGSAGTGKTTAALLRLARWQEQHRARTPSALPSALIVAPERGLVRAIRARIEHLELTGVEVETFDDWVTAEARRVFRKLPRRVCTDPPAGVSTLKRHPALHALLPRYVSQLGDELAARIDHALLLHGRAVACFQACAGSTLLVRLDQLERALVEQGLASSRELAPIISRERERVHDVYADLVELVGNRTWLEQAVADSQGELTSHMLEETLAHTRQQLATTTEKAYAHVDADRLRTLDERAIDEGTSAEYAGTIDVEDFALMFELLRLQTGGMATPRGQIRRHGHLIIDEVQELTPVELSVLGHAHRDDAVVSLSGDPAQHVRDAAQFAGWDAVLAQVGLRHARHVHLRHMYRCTQPIALLAHRILGPLAPEHAPEVPKTGEPVQISVVAGAAHRAFYLCRALMELVDRAPEARIAVIARKPESARQLHELMSKCLAARLIASGEFSFESGIEITDVSQIKGLEFDAVIIPDASASVYPDTPHERRLLHVAVTRALQTLWIMAIGAPTPLLGE